MQWEIHHNLEQHLHMQAEQDAAMYDESADPDDCVEWWQQVLLSQNDNNGSCSTDNQHNAAEGSTTCTIHTHTIHSEQQVSDEQTREHALRRRTRTHAAWTETARDAMLYHLQGTVDNPIDLEEHANCTNAPT